jgi:hypothetical protein
MIFWSILAENNFLELSYVLKKISQIQDSTEGAITNLSFESSFPGMLQFTELIEGSSTIGNDNVVIEFRSWHFPLQESVGRKKK